MTYEYYQRKKLKYEDQLDQIIREISALSLFSICKKIKLLKEHKEIWIKLTKHKKRYSSEWKTEIEKCY